jgi:adenylate kinase family enzyme
LNWSTFIIGDALRAKAALDPALREMLDRGELAPERTAVELMTEAARAAAGKGLVIDGFPRHREQVTLAQKLFAPWAILYLRVPVQLVESRLAARFLCPSCKWVGSALDHSSRICPRCGNQEVVSRPEDEPAILSKRINEAEVRLAGLLDALCPEQVLTLDASSSRDALVEQAVARLAEYSLAQET